MTYDIGVYMRVSPHDAGEQWNRELARLGVSHRIPADVLAAWQEHRQWTGAIPVNQNPMIAIDVYYDGTKPQKYAEIDRPLYEKSSAESRLAAARYVVNFAYPAGGTQAEWDALWWCATALTTVTDGVLADMQSEGDETGGLFDGEDVATYAREQIAAWTANTNPDRPLTSNPMPPTLTTIMVFSLMLFGLVFVFAFNLMGWSAEQDGLRYLLMAGVIGLDILVTFALVRRYRRPPVNRK